MSEDRSRLSKLLAKEQALRSDVGHDRTMRKSAEPSAEQVSILSPQSLQDTRKRLRRMLGSSSPTTSSADRSSSAQVSNDQQRASRSARPSRSRLLEHVLSGNKDDAATSTPLKVHKRLLISTPVDNTKSSNANPQARSLSPTLMRGGHYSLMTKPIPSREPKRPPPVTYFNLSSHPYEPRAEQDNPTKTSTETERESEAQEDDEALLKAFKNMQAAMTASKENLDAFEFLLKRHYDCYFDLSVALSAVAALDLETSHHAAPQLLHQHVAHMAKVLLPIDIKSMQIWLLSPQAHGQNRFFRHDSKRELNANLLRQQRPGGGDPLQASKVLVVTPSDEIHDDLAYAMEDGVVKRSGDILVYVVQGTGHVVALVLAAVAPLSLAPGSAGAHSVFGADAERGASAKQSFPALGDSNMARVGEYMQSLQGLIQKLTVERVGRAVQTLLDRVAQLQDARIHDQEAAKQEANLLSRQSLLTLSQLLTASPASLGLSQITAAMAKSCPIFRKTWVYLTKKYYIYDELSHLNNVFYDCLGVSVLNQKVYTSSAERLTPAQSALLVNQLALSAIDALVVHPQSEEHDFLFSALDDLVGAHPGRERLSLQRTSFEAFPAGASSIIHVSVLAETSLEADERDMRVAHQHLQDMIMIAQNALAAHHNHVHTSIAADLNQIPVDIYGQANVVVAKIVQSQTYAAGDVVDMIEDAVQSKAVCARLHARKCRMLFSTELAHALGFATDSSEAAEGETLFHYAKHRTVHAASAASAASSSLWLQDIWNNKIVLFTPGHHRAGGGTGTGTGEDFTTSSLQASRLSLHQFVSSLFAQFSSAMLVPIYTTVGLAVMVIVDYVPVPPTGVSHSPESLYVNLCFDQVFSQAYAQWVLTARVPDSLIAMIDQVYHVGTAVHQAHTGALRVQEVERENAQLLEKLSALVVRIKTGRVFRQWREGSLRSAYGRQLDRLRSDAMFGLRLFAARWDHLQPLEGADSAALLSNVIDNITSAGSSPAAYSDDSALDATVAALRLAFPTDRIDVFASKAEYQQLQKQGHAQEEFEVVGEVFHYAHVLPAVESGLEEAPAGMSRATRVTKCLALIRLSRRHRAISIDEKVQFLHMCKLAGLVLTSVATPPVSLACKDVVEMLGQCVPLLLSLQTLRETEEDMVGPAMALLLQWIKRTSRATSLSCTISQHLLGATASKRFTSANWEDAALLELAQRVSREVARTSSVTVGEEEGKKVLRFRVFSDHKAGDLESREESAEFVVLLPPMELQGVSKSLLTAYGLIFHVLVKAFNMRSLLVTKAASVDHLTADKTQLESSLRTLQSSLVARNQDLRGSNEENSFLYQLLLFVLSVASQSSLDELVESIWTQLTAVLGCDAVLLAVNERFLDPLNPQTEAELSMYHKILWPAQNPALHDFPRRLSLNQICNLPAYFSEYCQVACPEGKQFVIRLALPGTNLIFGALVVFVKASAALGEEAKALQVQHKELVSALVSAVVFNLVKSLHSEATCVAYKERGDEIGRLETVQATQATKAQELLSKVAYLEEHNTSLLDTLEVTRNRHQNALDEQQSAVAALEAEVSTLVKKLEGSQAYAAERIQLLEEENMSALQSVARVERVKTNLAQLVHSFSTDSRCVLPIAGGGSGHSALLWLREVAESRSALLFVIVNNALPDLLGSVAGLYTSVLEAQKNDISIVFTTQRTAPKLPDLSASVFNVSVRHPVAVRSERSLFRRAAIMIVPKRSSSLPNGRSGEDISCYVFVKELEEGATGDIDEAAGIGEDERDLFEAAANLTSKLVSSHVPNPHTAEDSLMQASARLKTYERAVAKYQQVYALGKSLLSRQHSSWQDIAKMAEECAEEVLQQPYLRNIQHHISVVIYESSASGADSERRRQTSKDVVRDGNSIRLPILSVFKRPVLGHIAVERVVREASVTGGRDSVSGSPDGQIHTALSLQDLLITDQDQEMLSVLALFVSYILSKVGHLSEAFASIQEASETIIVLQSAYNNIQEQYVEGIDNGLRYEECLKSTQDLLALASVQRTQLSQLVEGAQAHIASLTKSTFCALFLPFDHELCDEAVLSSCASLSSLRELPSRDQRTGYISYFAPDRDLVHCAFEASDVEAIALHDRKVHTYPPPGSASAGVTCHSGPSWTLRRYLNSLRAKSLDASGDEFALVAVPFALPTLSGAATHSASSPASKPALLVMFRPTKAFTQLDLTLSTHCLALLTYCISHRNCSQVITQHLQSLQTLQQDLAEFEATDCNLQRAHQDQDHGINMVDLLVPVMPTLSLPFRPAAPGPGADAVVSQPSDYVVSCVHAIFYASIVEPCPDHVFDRLYAHPDNLLEAALPPSNVKIVMKLGVLLPNDQIVSYPSQEPEQVVVGLLHMPMAGLHQLVKFGAVSSRRLLHLQFKLLIHCVHGWSLYHRDMGDLRQQLQQRDQAIAQLEMDLGTAQQSGADALQHLRLDGQERLAHAREQAKSAVVQAQQQGARDLDQYLRACALAAEVVGSQSPLSQEDLHLWGRLGAESDFSFGVGVVDVDGPSVSWTSNPDRIALPAELLQHVLFQLKVLGRLRVALFAEKLAGVSAAEHISVQAYTVPAAGHVLLCVPSQLVPLGPATGSSYVLLCLRARSENVAPSTQALVESALTLLAHALVAQFAAHSMQDRILAQQASLAIAKTKTISARAEAKRLIKAFAFKTMQELYRRGQIHTLEQRIQALDRERGQAGLVKDQLDDVREICRELGHLDLFRDLPKGIVHLWTSLQPTLRALCGGDEADRTELALIVWMDAAQQIGVGVQDHGPYRLIEVGAGGEQGTIMALGNRVHATLMDVFDPHSPLEEMYLIHRHAERDVLIYLIPVRLRDQAVAVMRVTLAAPPADSASHIQLLKMKRLEAKWIHLSHHLSSWLVAGGLYEEAHRAIKSQKDALRRGDHGLERLGKEIESHVEAAESLRRLGAGLGATLGKFVKQSGAIGRHSVPAQAAVQGVAEDLARALQAATQSEVSVTLPPQAPAPGLVFKWEVKHAGQVLAVMGFSEDVQHLLRPFQEVLTGILALAHLLDAQRLAYASLLASHDRVTQDQQALADAHATLEDQHSGLEAVCRHKQHYIDICADVLHHISTQAQGFIADAPEQVVVAVADLKPLMRYLQQLVDQYLRLYARCGQPCGISVALVNHRARADGLLAQEVTWVHADPTSLPGDTTADLFRGLCWEGLSEDARQLSWSMMRTCLESRTKSAVDAPSSPQTKGSSASLRVITLPVLDCYSDEVLGALQVVTSAAAYDEIYHPPVAVTAAVAAAPSVMVLFEDLAALLTRLLSFSLRQEAAQMAWTHAQIEAVHRETTVRSQSERISLLALQATLHPLLTSFFVCVLTHPRHDVLEVLVDQEPLLRALAEAHLVLRPRADGQTMDAHEAVSRALVPLSDVLSVEVIFLQPDEVVEKHELLSFAYNLMEGVSSMLSAVVQLQRHAEAEALGRDHAQEAAALVRVEQEAQLERQRRKVEKAAAKHRHSQALLSAALGQLLQSCKAGLFSAMPASITPQLSTYAEQLMALVIGAGVGAGAEEQSVQAVVAAAEAISRHILAATASGPSVHWSFFLLHAEQGDTENLLKGRMMGAAGAAQELVFIRDHKLRAINASIASAVPHVTSALDDSISAGRLVNRVYGNTLQCAPSDLLGVDAAALAGSGSIRVACVPVLRVDDSEPAGAAEEKTGPRSAARRPVVGVLRLVLQYAPAPADALEGRGEAELREQVRALVSGLEASCLDPLLAAVQHQAAVALSAIFAVGHSQSSPRTVALREDASAAKLQLQRLKKLHKVVGRESLLLLDPPSFVPGAGTDPDGTTGAAGATGTGAGAGGKAAQVQHVAALPPVQAAQDVAVKVLQVVRNLLRSEGQAIVLRGATGSAGAGSTGASVIYSGDAVEYPGVLPSVFGALTLSSATPSIVQEVLGSRQTVFLSDVGSSLHYNRLVDGVYRQPCCMLGVPIRGKAGSVVGVLFAVRPSSAGYSKEEQVAMEYMSNLAGLSFYWCDGLASTQHSLHKALAKVGRLEQALVDQHL